MKRKITVSNEELREEYTLLVQGGSDRPIAELAEKYGVSKQRVEQLVYVCAMPRARRHRQRMRRIWLQRVLTRMRDLGMNQSDLQRVTGTDSGTLSRMLRRGGA